MAAVTSVQSGNWSAATTWGGVVPNDIDDVTILPGHVVTLDADFVCSGSVTNNGTLTLSADLFIGTTASAIGSTTAGIFTFGAGSILNGNGNVYINRGTVNSTSTSSSWAKVEGSVSFGKTPSVADNYHWGVHYDVQYVSFVTSGVVLFPCRYTTTSLGSIKFKNCTFVGCDTVTFGVRSWTMAATPHSYTNLDFRNCKTITFAGTDPNPSGAERTFDSNTFYSESLQTVYFWIRGGEEHPMTNSAFVNYTGAITTYATPIFYKNCFFATTDTASTAKQLVYDNLPGSTLLDSFVHVHPTVKNSQTIKIDNVIGGVLDIESDNEPNVHLSRSTTASPVKTEGVLHIGYGDLASVVGASTLDWTVTNCTRVSHTASAINTTWISKTGVATPVSTGVAIKNCLQACLDASPDSYMARTSSSSLNQSIDFDYNCKWNVTDFLMSGVFTNSNAGSNNINYNPVFYDSSRDFVSWTQKKTNNSSAAYIDGYAYVLKLNGFDTTLMTQVSGTESAVSVSQMVDWVREGFAPTNIMLRTAGEGGTYIGAVPVYGSDVGGDFDLDIDDTNEPRETLADKLAHIARTKSLLREAIILKGVDVPEGTPFRQYVSKVLAISGGVGSGEVAQFSGVIQVQQAGMSIGSAPDSDTISSTITLPE